jgi:hypothetical protein
MVQLIKPSSRISPVFVCWHSYTGQYLHTETVSLVVTDAAQADWTHMSHKDTEQSTIEASITLDGVILTDPLIRSSSNE